MTDKRLLSVGNKWAGKLRAQDVAKDNCCGLVGVKGSRGL